MAQAELNRQTSLMLRFLALKVSPSLRYTPPECGVQGEWSLYFSRCIQSQTMFYLTAKGLPVHNVRSSVLETWFGVPSPGALPAPATDSPCREYSSLVLLCDSPGFEVLVPYCHLSSLWLSTLVGTILGLWVFIHSTHDLNIWTQVFAQQPFLPAWTPESFCVCSLGNNSGVKLDKRAPWCLVLHIPGPGVRRHPYVLCQRHPSIPATFSLGRSYPEPASPCLCIQKKYREGAYSTMKDR